MANPSRRSHDALSPIRSGGSMMSEMKREFAMTDVSKDLLPCPFCGEEGSVETVSFETAPDGVSYSIFCDGCHASSSAEITIADAFAAWNTRVQSRPSTPGVIERVRNALVAEIKRQTGNAWPAELESGVYLVDADLDFAALARAAIEAAPPKGGASGTEVKHG